ncbi:hypothetical protein [Pontibacter sp. G13]|uniref:hypothetical protein n=1 Tax=Pontibacter sp. G13 TaxID=3074898 RepID=UPI00288A3D49|nr:hypothetical protein [Pontibacter sp. G13]WNJ18964.1 hypothetical protein RJD25_00615 [Pontibacter sp. G13]
MKKPSFRISVFFLLFGLVLTSCQTEVEPLPFPDDEPKILFVEWELLGLTGTWSPARMIDSNGEVWEIRPLPISNCRVDFWSPYPTNDPQIVTPMTDDQLASHECHFTLEAGQVDEDDLAEAYFWAMEAAEGEFEPFEGNGCCDLSGTALFAYEYDDEGDASLIFLRSTLVGETASLNSAPSAKKAWQRYEDLLE